MKMIHPLTDKKRQKCWVYFVCVLVLMLVLLNQLNAVTPASAAHEDVQSNLTATPQPQALTGESPEPQETRALTREDMGYIDGAILCSAGLILIVVVGVLREIIRRAHNLPPTA